MTEDNPFKGPSGLERKAASLAPRRRDVHVVKEITRPHVDELLSSGFEVIRHEISNIRKKQLLVGGLDKEETHTFTKLMDSLVKAAREEREQEKKDDPGEWDREELGELVGGLLSPQELRALAATLEAKKGTDGG